MNSLWSRRIAFWGLLFVFFILITSHCSNSHDYKILPLEIQLHSKLGDYIKLLPDRMNFKVINISSVKKDYELILQFT